MKRDRFTLVMCFLHLNNNSQYRKLWGQLGPTLQAVTLSKEVSIDKSMIGFTVRLGVEDIVDLCWQVLTQGICSTGGCSQLRYYTKLQRYIVHTYINIFSTYVEYFLYT